MQCTTPKIDPTTQAGLDAGEKCRQAAHLYAAELGWSVSVCCPPDHVGVGKEHGKTCQSKGKCPLHLWKELQDRPMSADEIDAIYERHPNANVGVFLGPVSGIVRVDVDGPAGEAMLEQVSGGDLPDTVEFTSGRDNGGRGLLYAIPPGCPPLKTTPLKTDEAKTELRFQAKGAQTVLPPSRHPSGCLYKWSPGKSPMEREPAPMPAWLIDALRVDTNGKATRPAPSSNGTLHEGQRNGTLASKAGAMRRVGFDREAIVAALHAENAAKCDPPLDNAEVERIADSIARYEPARTSEQAEQHYQYRFDVIDAADLDAKDCRPEWGIKRVLVMKQSGVWGGPLKCMKTSTVFDAAVSLASATPFLSEFDVPRRRRVVVLSGESGDFAIQSICRRICHARGITLRDCAGYLKIGFKLPKFGNAVEMLEMRDGLERCGAEVAVLDPLYLSLFGGGEQDASSASNLYATGPLLLTVAQTCLEIGVTPIICHHFRRSVPPPPAVPELSWLSHSGVSEFARQWVLMSRREEYIPDSGMHRVWLVSGGSIGHSHLHSLDVDEGRLDDNFGGRIWQTTVQTAQQERATSEIRKQNEKDTKLAGKFLAALDELDPDREGVSIRKVRAKAGMSGDTVERALLQVAHCIEELKVKTARGLADGVRRRGTDGTDVGQRD